MVFCWLALATALDQTLLFDIAIRDMIHSWAGPPLTSAMRAVTWLGEPDALALLMIVAAWWMVKAGRRRDAFWLAIATLGALAISELLKLVFHRARPAAFFGYVDPSTYSFPSGHATVSCCFYGLLAAFLTARMKSHAVRIALWIGSAALVLAIGFSRIYLGVHYASDVVGGYALGIFWVVVARKVSFRAGIE